MAVFGRYETLAELGRGGMGVVYRGRALDTGAAVAIKVLGTADPEAVERFGRERRLLASFAAEDGFVSLLDSGVAGGCPYVVMPLLEGGTLATRLRGGPLRVTEAVVLVRALARALRLAHERGVIHRDLKPANVLFDANGRPFVADLGLAKHFRRDGPGGGASRSLTATGVATGTAGYMAPEQLGDGKDMSPRADVFALGVILHECLSGSLPFPAENVVRYARALKETRPPSLRSIPRAIDLVRARALALDPRDRFEDAGALERALAAATVPRRVPLVAAGASLVATLLVVGAFVLVPRTPALPAPRRAPAPAPVARTAPTAAQLKARAKEKAETTGDLDGAYEDLCRAIELDPKDAWLWMERGLVRGVRGDRTGALADEERAVELDPRNAEAWANRGSAKAQTGDKEDGMADLDHAVGLDPRCHRALYNRSVLRLHEGDLGGAIADLDRALELVPDHVLALVNRAEARHRKGDRAGELADLDRAIELGTRDPNAFFNRGAARRDAGNNAGAIADLERSLELAPDQPQAATIRAWIRSVRGQ